MRLRRICEAAIAALSIAVSAAESPVRWPSQGNKPLGRRRILRTGQCYHKEIT